MILVLIIVGMFFLHHPFLVIGVEKNFWGATSWTWDLHSSFRAVLQQTNHENLKVVHATGGPKFPAEPSPGDAVFFVQVSYKSLTDCWYKLYSIHGDYTNQKTTNIPKGNQYNQSIVVYI